MKNIVRLAEYADLPEIRNVYDSAKLYMNRTGNPNQWGKTTPQTSLLEDDIEKGDLYVLIHDHMIHGVFYFYIGPDPTYGVIENGYWRSNTPYGTIHRIAGDGSGGVLAAAVAFGKQRINHLRIDTHDDNKIMQHAVAKHGFQQAGIIHLANGSPRIAYDLLLE